MAKRITLSEAKEIIKEEIQSSLDNFMPARSGQTYTNGSFPRDPVYGYEVDGVKNEAKENSISRLRSFNDK